MALVACLLAAACAAMPAVGQDAADWRANLQRVHARFAGRSGTFAQFGDSITDTMAFWTPLLTARRNASPAMERAFDVVKAYQRPECWRDWKGPQFGSEGGQTTTWALKNVDGWLKRLNPEVALILFGTNDLRTMEADEYAANLRTLVRRCLDNGTFVILSTVPPRHGFERKAFAFAEAARRVARELQVPVTDLHAEIMKRRQNDWDGATDKFSAYKDYDVPTLISRDGVHPSNPQQYQNDYSDEALAKCGYSLRNYLTLVRYAEVVRALEAKPEPAPALAAAAGAAIDLPERRGKPVTKPGIGQLAARAAIDPPDQLWFPKAPRLPAPDGEVIRVSTAPELYAAAEHVRPGGTILLADGFYPIGAPLEIKTDRVALRGESGRRERVILDANHHGELLRITACTGVTIADLTLQNVQWNGIKINSETGVQRLTVYNCVLHNIWQRAIKGVKVPEKDRERLRPAGFRIQYCLFYNDHPKQFADDSADTDDNFHGNYIGGIDTMYPRDWKISDNVFVGIHGRTGEARGAVFLWHDVQDCIVERNIVIDCDSGICLGNSFRPEDVKTHCTGCIVRNNFVTRCHENGILADYTRDCKILNNTVYDPESKLGRLVRLVHDNDGLVVANNLVCGPPIKIESPSNILLRNNLQKDLTADLVDPASGNLRLTARAVEAIDKATPRPDVADDIDRKPRGPQPDIGAHELR
jgi:parallel beta-helix repeat protein